MSAREIHLERIIGEPIFDSTGREIGRLEEVRARRVGEELVVVDFLIGKGALVERFSMQLLGLFGIGRAEGLIVPWDAMDLEHLRTRCPLGRAAAL
jgi:sporulation protein YlmC with PRC-barrel domain